MSQDNYSQDEYNKGKDSFNSVASKATEPIKDKAKDFAKEAVKKAKEEAVKKLAAKKATGTITSWILSGFTAAGVTTVVPIIIIIITLTILPYSIFSLLSINKNYNANNDKVLTAINTVYNSNVNSLSVRRGISRVLNREYDCGGSVFDVEPQYVEFEGGEVIDSFYYETETCKITINLTPSAKEMIPKTSAYVHAVNGVLDYYSDPEDLDYHVTVNEDASREDPIYERYSYDTSDMPSLDSAENWYKVTGTDKETGLPKYESSNEVTTILKSVYSNSSDVKEETIQAKHVREALAKTIKVSKENLLFGEHDADLPIDEYFLSDYGYSINIHKAKWTVPYCDYEGKEVSMNVCSVGKQEKVCSHTDSRGNCLRFKTVTKKGEIKDKEIEGYKGDATLKVDYDISSYRKNELEALFTPDTETTIVGQGRCILNVNSQGELEGSDTCTKQEATRVIHNLLFSYYKSSYSLYSSNENINSLNDIIDFNFNRPITGVGISSALEYPSRSLDYISLTGNYSKNSSVGRYIWNHAFELRNAGLTGGASSDYQCTTFAQTWFYDIYGINSSGPSLNGSGNGNVFTTVVYDTWTYEDENGDTKHYFEFSDAPSAGGLISIDYFLCSGDAGTYGHIICCDEVNYEEGYIVISEGNTNGDGALSIRHKYSFDEFYTKYNGFMTFLNPTSEILEKSGVKYQK